MPSANFRIKPAVFLLAALLFLPLPSFAVEYCVDLSAFGKFGAMSFDVTTDDSAGTATVAVVAGYARGWEFAGSWDPTSQSGTVEMDEDPLVGYLAFDFDLSASPDISGYFPGTSDTLFTGTLGACTAAMAPLVGDYCLKVGNKNVSMNITMEGTGLIHGSLGSPSGSIRGFRARRDLETGLVLRMRRSGQSFELEFAGNLVSGSYTRGSRTYSTYGIRNPVTTSTGCKGIMLYSGGTANYYYSTPTIVGRYAYVGTGGGSNHPLASDNFLVKIDLKDMREVWRYELGTAEVRGSAVLDNRGKVYFVAEEGRTVTVPSHEEPEGDHSLSNLKLLKLSNPSIASPSLEWSFEIVEEGDVYDLGQITPAVSKLGNVYVGGHSVRAINSMGAELWAFSPSTGALEFYNAPLADAKSIFINSDGGGSDSSAATPNGIYAINAWTGAERWQYTPADSDSHYDGLSSPQFNSDRSRIYTALRQTLYCFDKRGNSCTTAWEDGCAIPDIEGDLRSSPLLDSNGDIYIGTKNDNNSKFYKIDGSCPSVPESRILWQVDTNADVYTTGVLLDSDIVVIGQEPDAAAGILKAFDTSDGSLVGFFDLTADMTWGSLRVHRGRLIGVADVATPFLGGFVFSIDLAGAGYETAAESPTFRGDNTSTGR